MMTSLKSFILGYIRKYFDISPIFLKKYNNSSKLIKKNLGDSLKANIQRSKYSLKMAKL